MADLKSTLSDALSRVSQKAVGARQGVVDSVRRTATKVRKVAQHVRVIAVHVIPHLVDPLTWIIVGVAVALVAAFICGLSVIQLVGSNENITGCVGGSSSSSGSQQQGVAATVTSGDTTKTANSVAGWLMSASFSFLGNKSMSKNQAAAVIGNMMQESTLNPVISNPAGAVSASTPNSALSSVSAAVGIDQWMGSRLSGLGELATQKGGSWSDINMQLAFLQQELDGSYGPQLVSAGFSDSSASVEKLTDMFEEVYEGAGAGANNSAREAFATSFLSSYTGGYTPVTGGGCLTAQTSGSGSSSVVQEAVLLSYPTEAQGDVSGSDPYGDQIAKQEYKDAKTAAMAKAGADGMPTLYASCDRFVATVIKLTEDPSVPWGDSNAQLQYYLANPTKWQAYTSKAAAKPGDVWVTNGHTAIYIGQYNGVDSVASASYLERVAGIGSSGYWNANLTDSDGRSYTGFHYIGGSSS